MKEKLVDKLKHAFHPNRITASSVGFSALGLALLQSPNTDVAGLAVLGLGYATDAIDGYAARKWGMQTIEGARLDPLVDKVRNVVVGSYIAGKEVLKGDYFLPAAMGVNFAVDYFSQKARGDITNQFEEGYNAVVSPENCNKDVEDKSAIRANVFGKTKTTIQTVVGLGYLGMEVLQNHGMLPDIVDENAAYVLCAGLCASAVLGTIGIVKRAKNKK